MSDNEREGHLGEVIDRRVQVYGDPVAGFAEIATMWSVLFDVEVPAWKVPIAQALMKVVRMKTSPDYSDHSDDIDGYLDIFRKIIGPDMIQARTVNEYIELKWGGADVDDDPDRTTDLSGEPIPYQLWSTEDGKHAPGCLGDHGWSYPCQVPRPRVPEQP